MSAVVIYAERLGKRYRIGRRERYLALRDVLANALRAPFRGGANGVASRPAHIWALKDVSFQVREGEVVGIIGRNGAGKTTLLKILARVTRPTEGSAEIRGRLGTLLEVGTGFHPELSGRENVFLSGAILGMRREEIVRRFDQIVSFAEVESFIDTPLKHYSSGMQMRLAFAVAAHLEPEILLVDEVLAVGDIEFQKKCLGKMSEVARGGRTILFVSHQMNQIRRLCERAMWIDSGALRENGPTTQVVGAYEAAMTSGQRGDSARPDAAKAKARFLRWGIAEPCTDQNNLLPSLGPVEVVFHLEAFEPVHRGHHGAALFNLDAQLMWASAENNLELAPGVHELRYRFPMLPLRPGVYSWQVTLWDDHGLIDTWNCVPDLIIAAENHQHPMDQWNGVLNVPSTFRLD